jgi:isopentenyldiphosphate isomerase
MNNAYYTQKIFLAAVDKEDIILRPVERWEAHKNGILHRGFTVIMMEHGKYILQHRKNPVFDNTWDFSFSSHQLYENNTLISDVESIERSLKREWNIDPDIVLTTSKLLGKVYYKAQDLKSVYTEHEIDYVYFLELKEQPAPNLDFCYGYELIDGGPGLETRLSEYTLSPWVQTILEEISLDTKIH